MSKDFTQCRWNPEVEMELRKLLEIAIPEDVDTIGDLTSLALVPERRQGSATIHARQPGVVAGIPAVLTVLRSVDPSLHWEPILSDGDRLEPGSRVGVLRGPFRNLLTAERPVLNLLGRLCGIASLTNEYVRAVSGIDGREPRIYDTRKTTLGWRRLEKYAVRCGGGRNHRTGLFDAILIKDNHLAFGRQGGGQFTPAEAVQQAREFLVRHFSVPNLPIVEIEVDTLQQLREVLPVGPDIVLLDNMDPDRLRQAVALRNEMNSEVQLEASGGINLKTVRAVAESGVERISVGALTHSAVSLDLGLDWGD